MEPPPTVNRVRRLRYLMPMPVTCIEAASPDTTSGDALTPLLLGLSLSWPWPERSVVAEARGLPALELNPSLPLVPDVRPLGSACGPVDAIRVCSTHRQAAAISRFGASFFNRVSSASVVASPAGLHTAAGADDDRVEGDADDVRDALLATSDDALPMDGVSPPDSDDSSPSSSSSRATSEASSRRLRIRQRQLQRRITSSSSGGSSSSSLPRDHLVKRHYAPAYLPPPEPSVEATHINDGVFLDDGGAWWVSRAEGVVVRTAPGADLSPPLPPGLGSEPDHGSLWVLPPLAWRFPRSGGVGPTIDAMVGAAGSCLLVNENRGDFALLDPRCKLPAWRAVPSFPRRICRSPAAMFVATPPDAGYPVVATASVDGWLSLFDLRGDAAQLPAATADLNRFMPAGCGSAAEPNAVASMSHNDTTHITAFGMDRYVFTLDGLPTCVEDTTVGYGILAALDGHVSSVLAMRTTVAVSDWTGYVSFFHS